jgi:hypothetical protein
MSSTRARRSRRWPGRLDEEKRRAALEKLDAGARIAANDAAPPEKSAPRAPPGVKNAKLEIDELKRDTLALELARRAGELVPVNDVESVILDAIAALQSAFDLETRATADQLTIDLGLSPERPQCCSAGCARCAIARASASRPS